MSKATKEHTAQKKAEFLEHYPTFLRTRKTAEAVGITEKTIYRWLEGDKDFKSEMTEVKKKIDTDRLEEVEKEIHRRGMDGESKQSDILLMFEAKALYPERYREKPQLIPLLGDITVKLAIPPYQAPQIGEGNADRTG